MKNIKDWSLKNKIILHITVIGILTALFLTYLYVTTQRNIIRTMSQQKAEVVATMIENSIFLAMKEGKLERVQSILKKVVASKDIKNVRISSPQGKILRSSQEDEIGSQIENQSLAKMKVFISRSNQSEISFIKTNSTIQTLRLINNKKACFGCHNPQQKINGILEVDIDYAMTASLLHQSQIKGIFIAFSSLIILAFIIVRLFEKLINRPISKLKNEMEKIQEGNLNFHFKYAKKDEIGSLTQSFNLMVKKLQKANHKIEQLFNKQMERAEHLASIGELAAGLAHEIKNPISGLKGALEIIYQKTRASDPKKEIFSEMLVQLEKINNIIQDLLSYARPKEMNLSFINPNECVENAIKLAKTQTNEKDISFNFKRLENDTPVLLDADKIQEVMLNLILNSISAIQKRGEISIKLDQNQNNNLEIIVSDNGKGIKKENLPHIFKPFFTTKKGGTGLGLSICKKIIEAHSGAVKVESSEEKGTTFIIQLPGLNPSN